MLSKTVGAINFTDTYIFSLTTELVTTVCAEFVYATQATKRETKFHVTLYEVTVMDYDSSSMASVFLVLRRYPINQTVVSSKIQSFPISSPKFIVRYPSFVVWHLVAALIKTVARNTCDYHRFKYSATVIMSEDVSVTIQKGLSEWWNEETEYIFQRIERWAAYARGYNRLRSQRLSRGRMTMQGGQEPRWSISSNKLIIDDCSWSPRFHSLKKSRRKSRPEETKIDCCATLNYQSNSNLDSSCLETYRYDHSIYFKTIGDIKNDKKQVNVTTNGEEDGISVSSEELIEWHVNTVSGFIASQLFEDTFVNDDKENALDSPRNSHQDANRQLDSVAWFNVNLSKLDLDEDNITVTVTNQLNNENGLTIFENEEQTNNNYIQDEETVVETNLKNRTQLRCVGQDENNTKETQPEEGTKKFLDVRRTRRSYRTVKQQPVIGDNEVVWPSVLLNYTKNISPSNSPHHYNEPRK